ncbi:MAG: glycosyltransferase family 39 protein [Planctomycetia bacterium]|nr:glycosyltransferase family 39 protein [Planctomycetia bacterium]
MMVIGSNWVISTHKHPAFHGWMAEIARQILRSPDWAPYVCSQLAVILSVYGIWRLAQTYLSPPLALIAALSMLSYTYFLHESIRYNNHTFLNTFWVLSVWFLWEAVSKNQLRYWILTGVCLALGIYCKLTMFLLVIAIVCYMTIDPKARLYWKTTGPYISTAVCFLLFLPLLFYMFQTDFSLLSYANTQTEALTAPSLFYHFWYPVKFLINQIPVLLLVILPLLPLLGFRWEFRREVLWQNAESRFLTFFFIFPIIFQFFLIGFLGGYSHTAWGCHLWLFFPLFSLYVGKVHRNPASWRRSIRLITFLVFFYFGLWATIEMVRPLWRQEKLAREYFPAQKLADHLESVWQKRYSVPLEYVRGDDWLAASASIWGKSRPTVYSPLWATEEDFQKKGGFLLWLDESCSGKVVRFDCYQNPEFFYSPKTGRPEEWLKKFPNAEILPTLELPQETCFEVMPVKIGVAVIPPAEKLIIDN